MSDLYDRVVSQQDALKKLIAKLPGFKGYFAMVDRRQADKVLREVIADRFQAQWARLSAIQRDMVKAGKIELVDDIEEASIKLRTFVDRVKTASYGYTGFFDAVKINEAELTQLYNHDLTLMEMGDAVASAIDNLEASMDTDGFPAALRNTVQKAQDSIDAFNKRSELMKMGQ